MIVYSAFCSVIQQDDIHGNQDVKVCIPVS